MYLVFKLFKFKVVKGLFGQPVLLNIIPHFLHTFCILLLQYLRKKFVIPKAEIGDFTSCVQVFNL